MDRCILVKPMPVAGQVLPAGMVVDAPAAYKNKLVAEGKAVWVNGVQAQANKDGSSDESPAPVLPKKKAIRKKVL